ncbi:hypothetical protein M770_30395 (plasmid) [Pseudomonas aeruginosa VRFPA03]|nr:hypothetical protein M770_30395 [Pseudomonas aeruginosa VRFPA03]
MATTSLVPLAGINNVAEDAALQRGGESPRLYVRDAVNIDLSPAGKAQLRASARQVTDQPFRQLWQSPLHGDAFGAWATSGERSIRIHGRSSRSHRSAKGTCPTRC